MQQAKSELIFDPNQIFPVPFTLISNVKKLFTSTHLKQPFAYEVYCPISCKKIKIGVISDNGTVEAMQFNTTSSRWISAYVNSDIKYLANGHNPTKKDKKKTSGENWSVYLEVQEKGNIAIFNPFYIDPEKPLSLYTFQSIQNPNRPAKDFQFAHKKYENEEMKSIILNGKTFYLCELNRLSYISQNVNFEDVVDKFITIVDPSDQTKVYRQDAKTIKEITNIHLNYWLDQLREHFIMEMTGVSKTLAHSLDTIYQKLYFYLNIDEQLRIKLLTNRTKNQLKELYPYHPRIYNAFNRLVSFLNYGDTKFDVFKLADLGFFNKTDMLQDIAYIEAPHTPIITAEESMDQTQTELRERTFPYARLNRNLSFPNVSLKTCLKSLPAQSVSNEQVILTEISDPYVIFVNKSKKVSAWSGRFNATKLFQIDLLKEYQTDLNKHSILIIQNQPKVQIQQPVPNASEQNDLMSIGDIFNQEESKPKAPPKPIEPDQNMVEQLIAMGYKLNIAKQALINIKNESVVVALDQIEKLIAEEKKVQKKKKLPTSEWTCKVCTFINQPAVTLCQICGSQMQYVDEEENEKKIKEQEQKLKKQQQEKKQIEKKKLQKEKKEQEEEQRKKKQEVQKKAKYEFLNNSQIKFAKLFRSKQSSVNPFVLIVSSNNKQANKSFIRVLRIGYTRSLLTQFIRHENKFFVSNFNRAVYQQQEKSLQPIEQILTNFWTNVEVINRLIQPYREDQYFVLEEKTVSFDGVVEKLVSDGEIIAFSVDGKQRKLKIQCKDDLEKSLFDLIQSQDLNVKEPQKPLLKAQAEAKKVILLSNGQKSLKLKVPQNTTTMLIEVLENVPVGQFKALSQPPKKIYQSQKTESEVVMSQFLPLMIEHYEGSIFSSKYHPTSLFQRTNLYISNYPETNFTFKSIQNKAMVIESCTVISQNKRLQKIYPIETGLIFTANEVCWFQIAKKYFGKFTRKDYDEWKSTKIDPNAYREYWEPVAFFEFDSQTEFEIQFKRPAKYVFFLPTGVRTYSEKVDVAAVKIDFFGVKGRVEQNDEQLHAINNFKNDCEGYTQLTLDGTDKLDSIVLRKRSALNTINYLPKSYEGFKNVDVSISTFYELKFRKPSAAKQIQISSEYLTQICSQSHCEQSLTQSEDSLKILSYTSLLQNFNNLSQLQVIEALESLYMKDLVLLILNNSLKSFKTFDKILKIVYETEELKTKLFDAILQALPCLAQAQYQINQYGLKTFLRIFEKLSSIDNKQTLDRLAEAMSKLTAYVASHRNRNYTVIRNNYGIEELILEPSLFSRDYYRLIHPNYIEQQDKASIVQDPKTQLNNTYYLQTVNPWYYKSTIDLKEIRQVNKVDIYFPKVNNSLNRFKLQIKVYVVNDNSQQIIYHKHWNEQMLFQFGLIAYKDKDIYSGSSINYFTIDVDRQARFLKIQYNYLLLTTLNPLRYKQPTEPLTLYPLVKSSRVQSPLPQQFTNLLKYIEATFPKQTKHNLSSESLPPFKYSVDRSFTLHEIYQFPISNPESVSKQYSSLIDKITTNIMDQKIVEECMKNMKISQYHFNQKGLDFAYTLMINFIRLFKHNPQDKVKIDVQLLLKMFQTFVIYEIGPIMKRVMHFISDLYQKLSVEEKSEFVSQVISRYLSNFSQYKQLKQNEKYSLTKVIEKLQQLQLPIGLLMNNLSIAFNSNNRFLISMLLKLIRPNIEKFSLKEEYLKLFKGSDFMPQVCTLKDMIDITFKFNLWVLNNVESLKIELLSEGLELLLIIMDGNHAYVQENKMKNTTEFINSINEEEIWKLVFLTLKIKNSELNSKVHSVFQLFMKNTTEKFQKGINTMLLEIIKKQLNSTYTKINGQVNDDLWMNHLQTILEYLDIQSKSENQPQPLNKELSQKSKKKQFSLDIETAIQLLNLPLTPVLWSHALLIIPKDDRVLNAIIKNFKKQYYSSLGKEITKFCEPLAGIRSLESIHINWLDLVKKIRLQNRSIFSLFVEELKKASYGGKEGVTMATHEDVKQLEIASEFLKLVLQKDLEQKELTEQNLQEILVWYFLNNTDLKGQSPSSEFLKAISENVLKLIQKVSQCSELVPTCIKCILQIKKDSEKMQGMFQEKRLPTHSALSLSKRFCKCFEDLMLIFVSNDKMSEYFAFQINGLEYIMEKLSLLRKHDLKSSNKEILQTKYLPEQEFLLDQKILAKKVQANIVQAQIKSAQDLKQEEFANNVKVVANLNQTASTASTDWTVYKKGNKTKIIFLPMTDPATYFEYPLYVELSKTVEVRSIKIGFPCASFEFTDKIVVSPSSVVIEGSTDMKSFEPLGEMTYIDDDGYLCNGVKVFALNLQKIKKSNKIDQAIKGIELHRIKYLKIVVKRPLVTFIEGQYSQLNGRVYSSVGVSISFLSVVGDDTAKLPNQLVDSCKEMSKKTALHILSTLLTESNLETMKRISNDQTFSSKIKQNFSQVKQLMFKYKQTVPQIIYSIGSNNVHLGDWLIEHFIKSGKDETQAKIINQIIVSTPNKIYERINYFQKQLFRQFSLIRSQSQVESSLLYARYVPFLESFCKTLQECYELDFKNSNKQLVLDCDQSHINSLIDVYDKKYSSPDIKSLLKILIAMIWIRKPLSLKQQVISNTLDLIWRNCSQAKPYFYNIMSALLVSKASVGWILKNDHEKIKLLIKQIDHSIEKDNYKALRTQMFLMSILSYHESEFLRFINYHINIYNALKVKTFADAEIYDYLMKILQNVVLGHKAEQEKLAAQLKQDVSLLVKRKDPILQKLFVGLLGVEQQVMIHLKGMDIVSINSSKSKKVEGVPSKILTRQEQKALAQKLSKKFKYHLAYQSQRQISTAQIPQIVASFYTASSLIIFKVKVNNQIYHIGLYCPVKPIKKEQDYYLWEEELTADKNCFLFSYHQNEHSYITPNLGEKFVNVFNCDEEQDHSLTVLKNNDSELIRLAFNGNGQIEVKGEIIFGKDKNTFQKAILLNVQVFQCKSVQNSSTTQSKLSNLLSKSNQAKVPFTWYRHNPIYIFPSEITVAKLEKLLSAKITVENLEANESFENTKLKLIENEDFIIDVVIQNPDDYSGEQDFGYIPKMNVFDSFSQLDGINQVLRLGSQSIKDWKNATRKKNFEHYMQQLKSFIHLPNFFSLFIKNHTYVTFLFEVAAGMPDDPATTRNWQEEQVNSSRFIYKILSDIFKFDRSKELRDMNKYEDFCQIILEKLTEISKQAPRVFKEDQPKQQQNLEVADKLEKKKTQEQKRRKKKGTGYGADNQNNSKWSSAEWLENKKMRSQQILRVVSIFVSFLDCEVPIEDDRLSQIIKSSCLLPLIESALRSSSLLQIAKEIDLFKNYLSIIKNMAKNPATIGCLLQIEKNYKPQQTESIHSLLGKLNNISEIFLECLKSGKQSSTDPANQNTESLATQIQKTFSFIDKAVRNLSKAKNALTIKQINDLPIQQAYRILLEKLRFGYIDMKKGTGYDHCLHSSVSSSLPSTQKILRLSQQLADLSSSLPCQHTNSIFVRCDKSRIDLIKILIMGSKDTPYSNGAFMFDLYCDDSYPNNPPKMVIATTGQGKIRFNPNLYSCGKVCLSLLGTWRGSASENWDPKLSTLLQLFISTQGITMSEDVYFNEPGFDGQQGTEEGDKKNEAYSNIVRLGNVRYAMIEQIKNPPKGFEDVIQRHFYLKKKEIIEQCEKWLQWADKRQASYAGLVSDHNSSWCTQLKASKTKYKELLQKDIETLKQVLNQIPEPDLKQKNEEQVAFKKADKKKRKAKQAELEIDVGYDNEKKNQLKIQEDVMQDRWSRYIGAMGLEAVKKQSSSNVLLVGLKPLGLEIAKNLILSGLQKLTIVENQKLDSGSQEHFYMSDLKGKEISECIFKLKQLNPYMLVEHKETIPESLKDYHLVVSTLSVDQSMKISVKCRKENVKFVYSETCGVSGSYFADFGEKFTINDTNGQEPFEGLIEKITCEKQGVVKLLQGVRHPYQDGDYVVFNKVQGMDMVNQLMQQPSEAQQFYNKTVSTEQSQKLSSINGRVFQIKVINWNSFSIGDTTNFTPYIRNGIVKNIKVPKLVKFESFENCVNEFDKFVDPNLGIYDFEKMGDNFSVFACFTALSKFVEKNKCRPHNWNEAHSKEFVQIVKQICTNFKKSEEGTKEVEKFATKFSLVAEAQLPTIGAYLGGLVSQQIIKGLTDKYTPINQFFVFHLNELIQKIPEQSSKWTQLSIKKEEAFRNIKIVIGQQNMNKIENMKLFVVGAGAIGCELLKNFAMVNMGAKGKITVTDPDHIQTSNLTRQFLFRQKHVKKPKSATAAAVLMQMNPNLKNHISARLDKVCEESQDIYSDEFFKSQTVIANALDNVKARQYMDKRCVTNKIPLFESGTLGPKGHVQVIVPFKTENYGSQADPEQQAQIPHCTLKMFPEDITHCIQWSRDIFGKVFTLNPKALKKIIDSKDTTSIQGKEKSTVLKMIKFRPTTFEQCIDEAVRIFFKYFRNDIRQLLYTYPLDMKTKEGKLFWTLPKRPPRQISKLDQKDESHLTFISSYAVLFAKIFSIQYPQDFRKPEGKAKIMQHAIKVKIQDFVPNAQKSKQLQQMNEKQQKAKEQIPTENEKPEITEEKVEQQIKLTPEVLQLSIKPQEFQKDEDGNGHIDLIYSMSNLRARNYDLGECKWIDAKLKAGRIMAALSTTTSVVAAIQTLEIIKLVSGSQVWRNAFVNLAVPLVQITEPGPAPKSKIGNTEFSVWQDWQFKASSLKDLLKQIEDKYEIQGFNISTAEGTPIFWQAMYKDKQQAQETLLNKNLSQLIGKDKTTLNILFRDLKGQIVYEKVPKVVVQASE